MSIRDKEKLVDKLLMSIVVFDAPNKPGALVKRTITSKKEKELLKTLTAEDFNHRVKGLI